MGSGGLPLDSVTVCGRQGPVTRPAVQGGGAETSSPCRLVGIGFGVYKMFESTRSMHKVFESTAELRPGKCPLARTAPQLLMYESLQLLMYESLSPLARTAPCRDTTHHKGFIS